MVLGYLTSINLSQVERVVNRPSGFEASQGKFRHKFYEETKKNYHYKKNPNLQRKFCNRQMCCKIVTVLQQNANKSVISKLQLNCN